jgi:hypothetical protein
MVEEVFNTVALGEIISVQPDAASALAAAAPTLTPTTALT